MADGFKEMDDLMKKVDEIDHRTVQIDIEIDDEPIQDVRAGLESLVDTAKEAEENIINSARKITASFSDIEVTEWANSLINSGMDIQRVFDAIEKKMAEINAEMEEMDDAKPVKGHNYVQGAKTPEKYEEADRIDGEITKDAEALESLKMMLADLKEEYAEVGKAQEQATTPVDTGTNPVVQQQQEIVQSMQETQDKQRETEQSAAEFARNLKATFEENYLSGLVEQYNELETKLDAYRDKLSQVEQEEARVTAQRKEMAQGGLNAEDQGMYEALGKRLEELKTLHEKLTSAYDSTAKEQSSVEKKIIKAAPKEDAQEQPPAPEATSSAEIFQKIFDLQNEIQKKQDDLHFSTNLEKDVAEIDALKKKLKEYITLVEKVTGQKWQDKPAPQEPEPETKSYKDYKKETRELPKQISQAKMQIVNADDTDAAIAKVKELEEELKRAQSVVQQGKSGSWGHQLADSFKSLGGHLAGAVKPAVAGLKEIGVATNQLNQKLIQTGATAAKWIGGVALQGFEALAQGAMKGASALSSLATHGMNLLGSGIQTAASGIGKLAHGEFNLLASGAKRAADNIQNLVSKFRNLGGNTAKSTLKGLMSIKSMLKRRVKRTFISAIFNQAKEGMQQLAKYNSAFNASMSNIKNSSKQAAGNLSVTMGNIVTTIEPYITKLLTWLSTIFEKVNAVFSMLSGKGTVTVAKKSTDNYAKSLDNAASAAKDLNSQVYGFDELTKQQDNSGSSGGSKIGYEEQEIGSVLGGLQETFQSIIDAFKKGQFEKVGELVAGVFNNIINTVDKKIVEWRSKATQWTSNIARILNGIVTGIDWANVGKLFGDGFNLIFDVANTFFETFEWGTLGNALSTGVNSLFDTIEWDLLGETFANGFNSVQELINGFVTNFDWGNAGDKIAQGLSSFFDNLDFETKANNIVSIVNGFVQMLSNIINGVNWAELFEKMATSLNYIVQNIDWEGLGKLFADGINTIFGSLNTFLDTFDFFALGEKLATGINSLVENVNFEEVGAHFAKLGNAIWQALAGFVTTINWGELGLKLATGIQSMFDNIDWNSKKTAIVEGVNGIVTALSNLINNVDWSQFASDLASNLNAIIGEIDFASIGTLLSDGFNSVFGALSTFLTEFDFASLGSQLATGLQAFINNVDWTQVSNTISGFINGLTDLFYNLVTGVNWVQLATDLLNALDKLITDIDWKKISELLSTNVNTLIDVFGMLVTNDTIVNLASKLGELAGNFLKDINWDKLGEDIGTGIGKLADAFGKLVEGLNLHQIATSIAEGINALFDPEKGGAGFETAVGAIGTGIDSVIKAFAALIDPETGIDFTNIGTTIGTSISTLVTSTDWATLLETLTGLGIDIFTTITTAIAEVKWDEVGQALADAINGIWSDDNTDRMAKLGESISNALKGVLEGAETLLAGIDLSKIFDGFITLVTKIDWLGIVQKAFELMVDTITTVATQLPDLVTKLVEFVGQIPWLDIAKEIITGIGDVLVAAVKGIASFVGSIVDMCKNIDWLEVGKAILTGIGDILLTAVKAVGGLISTVWTAIFGGGEEKVEVPQILTDDVMNQLRAQMGEAGKELAHELNKSLIENIDDAGSDYEAAKQLFLNSAAEIGLGFQDTLEETLRKNGVSDATIASLAEQTQRIFDACKAPDATVDSIKEQFRASGIWITDGLAEAFMGEGQENIASALQLMALGVDQETIAALDMSHLNENITRYMNESGESIEAIAGSMGANVGEKIGGTIPEFIQKALEQGKQEVANTAQEVQEAADTSATQAEAGKNAAETGKVVTENLTDNLASDAPASKAEETTNAVKEKYEALPDAVKPYAEQLMEYIVTALSDGDGTVKAAIEAVAQSAVDRAKEILNGETGAEIAKTFIDSLKGEFENKNSINSVSDSAKALITGVRDAFESDTTVKGTTGEVHSFAVDMKKQFSDELTEASGNELGVSYIGGISSGTKDEYYHNLQYEVQDIAYDYVETLQDAINYDNGYDISYYIMEGLAEGLSGNRSAVVGWAAAIADDLVDTFMSRLEIGSPSKVFAELGHFTTEGLNQGLQGGGDKVLNTVSDLASAIVQEGENIGIEPEIGVMTSGLDVVTEKMSRIAQIFTDIGETILNMGKLEVPAIASGQVIPYKARVETVTNAENTAGMFNGHEFENALYNAFTRAMSSPDNEQTINVTLQVDGRKIADVVSKYQRQQSRAWG